MASTESSDVEASSNKKRSAAKQIRKEDDIDDLVQEDAESTTWKKADEDTLRQRRIIKVRRNDAQKESSLPLPTIATSTPQNNTSENKSLEQTDVGSVVLTEKESKEPTSSEPKEAEELTASKDTSETSTEKPKETGFSFAASQPVFNFPKSSPFSSAFGSQPGTTSSSSPIFGFNIQPPAETSTLPVQPASPQSKPVLSNEPVATGEEEEQHVFQTRAKLFCLDKESQQWRERGVGMLRINLPSNAKDNRARLLMRVESTLRLILNIGLWPSMVAERAGDKSVRFVAPSLENPSQPCTYLIRLARAETATELLQAIEQHKGNDKQDQEGDKPN